LPIKLSLALISAPLEISISAISLLPPSTAECKGVRSQESLVLISAPLEISISVISLFPL
jgi:hypothetical protein